MRVSIWRMLIRFQAHILSCFLLWKVIVSLVNEVIQIKVMKVLRRTWYNGCRMILFTHSKSSSWANYARQTVWVHRWQSVLFEDGKLEKFSSRVYLHIQPSVRKQSQVFENELLLNLSLHVYVKLIVICPFIFHLHYS